MSSQNSRFTKTNKNHAKHLRDPKLKKLVRPKARIVRGAPLLATNGVPLTVSE